MIRINTAGLSQGAVLAALFNKSQPPRRMGTRGFNENYLIMNARDGQRFVDSAKSNRESSPSWYHVDNLFGRPIKVVFNDDESIEVGEDYEDDNGEGAAQAAIDHLRSSGKVLAEPTCSARQWLEQVTDEALLRYDEGDKDGCLVYFWVKMAHHPRTRFISTMKPALGLILSSLDGTRSEARRAMLAWTV